MSFTIGIYDLFAYTLPGLLYLYVLYAFLSRFGSGALEQVYPPSIPDGYGLLLFVLLLGSAYLLGHLLDVFAQWFVFRLFRPVKLAQAMLERTRSLHADLDIKFQSKDRGLLFSMLRQRNMEHARIIDSFEANSIMLRNISFGLFLLALLQIYAMFVRFSLFAMTTAAGLLLLSFVARQRSHMFHSWSLTEIFESSLRYGSSLEEVLAYDRKEERRRSDTPTKKASAKVRR